MKNGKLVTKKKGGQMSLMPPISSDFGVGDIVTIDRIHPDDYCSARKTVVNTDGGFFAGPLVVVVTREHPGPFKAPVLGYGDNSYAFYAVPHPEHPHPFFTIQDRKLGWVCFRRVYVSQIHRVSDN